MLSKGDKSFYFIYSVKLLISRIWSSAEKEVVLVTHLFYSLEPATHAKEPYSVSITHLLFTVNSLRLEALNPSQFNRPSSLFRFYRLTSTVTSTEVSFPGDLSYRSGSAVLSTGHMRIDESTRRKLRYYLI